MGNKNSAPPPPPPDTCPTDLSNLTNRYNTLNAKYTDLSSRCITTADLLTTKHELTSQNYETALDINNSQKMLLKYQNILANLKQQIINKHNIQLNSLDSDLDTKNTRILFNLNNSEIKANYVTKLRYLIWLLLVAALIFLIYFIYKNKYYVI